VCIVVNIKRQVLVKLQICSGVIRAPSPYSDICIGRSTRVPAVQKGLLVNAVSCFGNQTAEHILYQPEADSVSAGPTTGRSVLTHITNIEAHILYT
jgi:hypothetical protein